MKESSHASDTLKKIEKIRQSGWDEAALNAYIKARKKDLKNIDQQIFLIGSEIYTEMFNKSQLSAYNKVMIVINHLGGYQDDFGDLQFIQTEYSFDNQMQPGSLFFKSYSKAVQCAYPKGLVIAQEDKRLSKIELKKKYPAETKIHQFRNQLDKCAIRYIKKYKRSHGLKNDEAAIKMVLGNDWFYADPQYHNRGHLGSDIFVADLKKGTKNLTNKGLLKKIRKRGFYRKILSGDYHSEFILDEQGQLLSQWNEQIETRECLERAIANGETFNYGIRPRFDQYQTHDNLDGTPPNYFDTDMRNELKKNWLSPTNNWFYQLIRRLSEKGLRYKRKKYE